MTQDSAYTPFITRHKDGPNEIVLSVDGVHCPVCIQKIESALAAQNDVKKARLNYTTKRLTILWQGATTRVDDFMKLIEDLGYKPRPFEQAKAEASDSEYARFLRLCLGVSGFASGNIMLLSFALWITTTHQMGMMTREFFHLISGLIAVPAVAFAGRPFFRSALSVISKGRTNMDVPISLGILGATGMSLYEMTRGAEHVFFDSAVMLTFFLLIGRYLDFLALSGARRAARDLMSMMAGTATVLGAAGETQTLLIRDLREGMTALVAMGERIPADAIVLEGESEIDTSPVTGESLPVRVTPGDTLYSGTINASAPLKIKIVRAAGDSLLADVIRMMEKAEQGQARYVRIADRAARLYTPAVHTLAALTLGYWVTLGGAGWEDSIMTAITVLIITCPCALGLAVPVVQMLAVGRLMKRGVMVKTGDALERLAKIDTVMCDKTGTLTLGSPALQDTRDHTPEDMKLAASLAAHSRHPLSKALAQGYTGPLIDLSVEEVPGRGLQATHDGKTIRLGSRSWCGDKQAEQNPDLLELWLNMEGRPPTAFHFADPMRRDAKDVLDKLREGGLNVILASGDRAGSVEKAARDLAIKDYQAAMKPGDKFALLEDLRKQGHAVLMLGDGLNDAPVLAGADVSASPASGLDIARNAADLVYTGDLCQPILSAWKVARFSQKLVVQNFALAIAYNVVAVPLAMAGHVTPMIAAIAMSSSSLIVIANAMRLRTIV